MRGAARTRSTESFGSFVHDHDRVGVGVLEHRVDDRLGTVDAVQHQLAKRLEVLRQRCHRPVAARDALGRHQLAQV